MADSNRIDPYKDFPLSEVYARFQSDSALGIISAAGDGESDDIIQSLLLTRIYDRVRSGVIILNCVSEVRRDGILEETTQRNCFLISASNRDNGNLLGFLRSLAREFDIHSLLYKHEAKEGFQLYGSAGRASYSFGKTTPENIGALLSSIFPASEMLNQYGNFDEVFRLQSARVRMNIASIWLELIRKKMI